MPLRGKSVEVALPEDPAVVPVEPWVLLPVVPVEPLEPVTVPLAVDSVPVPFAPFPLLPPFPPRNSQTPSTQVWVMAQLRHATPWVPQSLDEGTWHAWLASQHPVQFEASHFAAHPEADTARMTATTKANVYAAAPRRSARTRL